MASIQLNFTLRTSSHCKTVHLLGSWDGYQGQLPLSKDHSKSGGWTGSFKFSGASLKQGSRYWYYYIIDGYHVSHDPARDHTTEPTTGRKLNILDIPAAKSQQTTATKATRTSHRLSANGARGRALSPSRIAAPKPQRPGQTRQVINTEFNKTTLEALNRQFAQHTLAADDDDDSSDYDSDDASDVPSLTSRSTNSSSPSSVSSGSSCCTCERYGITRAGDRVKLDCGGARCGFSDESDECSSEDEYVHDARSTRRQGIVVRR